LHGFQRILRPAEFAITVDFREIGGGAGRALAERARQEVDGFVLAILGIDQNPAGTQPLGQVDLRILIAAVGGEPV
jgi:hypothetical protein